AMLYGEEFAETAAGLKPQLPGIGVWITMDGADIAADHVLEDLATTGPLVPEIERKAEDLAGIFYTGGTTGLPKGVMLSHRALAAMAVNLTMSLQVDHSIVNLHSAPMFHLADIGTFMATMVGGTHVFVRKLDENVMLDLIDRWGITHIFTVPAMIDRLARHPKGDAANALKVLGYGGAPMPLGTYDVARARFPNVDFVQGFGMTEMGAHTFLEAQHHRPGADPEKMKSVGQPAYGYEIRIVDPEGVEVPRRTLGEIVGRGDNVMMGYWNRPEAAPGRGRVCGHRRARREVGGAGACGGGAEARRRFDVGGAVRALPGGDRRLQDTAQSAGAGRTAAEERGGEGAEDGTAGALVGGAGEAGLATSPYRSSRRKSGPSGRLRRRASDDQRQPVSSGLPTGSRLSSG
ncbi:MAG: fatty-acid--CoA ligase, partial [Caulobacter sp.]|nr:fatty-acid--CoA ligase [Caulobacter sp.]